MSERKASMRPDDSGTRHLYGEVVGVGAVTGPVMVGGRVARECGRGRESLGGTGGARGTLVWRVRAGVSD